MQIEVQKVINVHFIMKVSVFMLLLRFFVISAAFAGEAKGQVLNQNIELDLDHASVIQSLQKIEAETSISFSFATQLLKNNNKQVTLSENLTVKEALVFILADTGIKYRIVSGYIVLEGKPGQEPGKIQGLVVDEYGMPLPGATVQVLGTDKVTISDENGAYSFSLLPGNYTVEISYMSFQTQKITDVAVIGGKETKLNVALKSDAQSLDEVVITQTYQKATASVEGLLLQQKRAAQFSDGISAEQIARTPDSEVGSTLKRITGVTTVDDKFVVVRSMGERWNQAAMDGVNLPSTDANQQQFNFDIIPTAMVESIVVSKNATPDMYANFAGGYVEVKTKAIPKEDFTTFSIGTSYNSRSTFKDRLTRQQGSTDYLGFDDGTRDYPSGLVNVPVPTSEAESGPFFEQSKKFTEDNFSTYKTYAAPGNSLQFALGRSYELKDNNKWGFVGSLIFKNTQEQLKIEHTERGSFMPNTRFIAESEDGYTTLTKYGFKNSGASYNFNSTLGGMLNAGIQLGDHKITVRNTLMHIFDNQLTQVTGWNYYADELDGIFDRTNLPDTQETSYPVFQTFIQNKVEGEHKFGELEVNWFGAYGNTAKDTKDATFLQKYRRKVGDDILTFQNVYNSATRFPMGRANFTNEEINYNTGITFKYALDFGDMFKNEIRAGYFGTYKKATNQQESVNLRAVGQGADGVDVYFPVSELLDASQYQWGGFGWERQGYYGNRYEGDVKVHSPFLMLDNKISRYVRLVWGVRAESYVYSEIASQSENADADLVEQKDDEIWQYLPSASLTISPTDKINIRLGYNKSVLRPQFSERLKIPYYDPIRSAMVLNWTEGIVSTVSDNYDFKFEWFPALGQVLSFGVYHKNIQNPIEGVTQLGGDGGSRTIFIMNSHSAKLWGVELEILKSLSFLGEGDILEDLFVYANAAINETKVTSYVRIDGEGGLYEANRPLFGQSPYTYNLGLDYVGERLGFSIRHNATGDQYILVGFRYDAEEIRMPYAVTDATISCKIFKERNFQLKLGVKNLFDRPIETYNNINSYSVPNKDWIPYVSNPRGATLLASGATKRYDEDIDRKLFKAYTGTTLNFTISYSF